MADPFSIAAGVIGVVSLSMLLVEKAHKLSGILKSIKDFPDEVKSIVKGLETLTETLE